MFYKSKHLLSCLQLFLFILLIKSVDADNTAFQFKVDNQYYTVTNKNIKCFHSNDNDLKLYFITSPVATLFTNKLPCPDNLYTLTYTRIDQMDQVI